MSYTIDFGAWIQNAFQNFINWISDTFNNFINWIFTSFQNFIVTPIQNAINTILYRLVDRIDRVIFVSITLPIEINLIKDFIKNPTEKKFFKIITTPIFAYVGGAVVKELLKSYLGLKPPQLPQIPQPTSPPSIPQYRQRFFTIQDSISISDSVKHSFKSIIISEKITEPPLEISDSVSHSFKNKILLQKITEPPIEISDSVSHSLKDRIVLQQILDSISIDDSLTLQLSYLASAIKYDGYSDTGLTVSVKYDGYNDVRLTINVKYDGYTDSSIIV